MIDTVPVTICELPRFTAWAETHWDRNDLAAFIDYIARNPLVGDIIRGTGGVRKVRWTLPGTGKRGGARVIYYFLNAGYPLTLLTAYSKSEKADLSASDKKAMRDFVNLTKTLSRRGK